MTTPAESPAATTTPSTATTARRRSTPKLESAATNPAAAAETWRRARALAAPRTGVVVRHAAASGDRNQAKIARRGR